MDCTGFILILVFIFFMTWNGYQMYYIIKLNRFEKSVKVGDIFANELHILYEDVGDPFDEKCGSPVEYDPNFNVIVLDIKKNNKGERWVKYCLTNKIHNGDKRGYTEKLEDFLKYKKRIGHECI